MEQSFHSLLSVPPLPPCAIPHTSTPCRLQPGLGCTHWAQRCPLAKGNGSPSPHSRRKEHCKQGPTSTPCFPRDKMATAQLQNVLTSAAGRGPERSPSPVRVALSSKGTVAIVRWDWMLPCIHFGLMKAHSSEEKYLHSASQVVTFAQMTHKQAPPAPFSNPNLFRGLQEEGGCRGAEQKREQNANKSASRPFSPPLCGVNGKCHFTC